MILALVTQLAVTQLSGAAFSARLLQAEPEPTELTLPKSSPSAATLFPGEDRRLFATPEADGTDPGAPRAMRLLDSEPLVTPPPLISAEPTTNSELVAALKKKRRSLAAPITLFSIGGPLSVLGGVGLWSGGPTYSRAISGGVLGIGVVLLLICVGVLADALVVRAPINAEIDRLEGALEGPPEDPPGSARAKRTALRKARGELVK